MLFIVAIIVQLVAGQHGFVVVTILGLLDEIKDVNTIPSTFSVCMNFGHPKIYAKVSRGPHTNTGSTSVRTECLSLDCDINHSLKGPAGETAPRHNSMFVLPQSRFCHFLIEVQLTSTDILLARIIHDMHIVARNVSAPGLRCQFRPLILRESDKAGTIRLVIRFLQQLSDPRLRTEPSDTRRAYKCLTHC